MIWNWKQILMKEKVKKSRLIFLSANFCFQTISTWKLILARRWSLFVHTCDIWHFTNWSVTHCQLIVTSRALNIHFLLIFWIFPTAIYEARIFKIFFKENVKVKNFTIEPSWRQNICWLSQYDMLKCGLVCRQLLISDYE